MNPYNGSTNVIVDQCFNVSNIMNSYESASWLQSIEYWCAPNTLGMVLETFSVPCNGSYGPLQSFWPRYLGYRVSALNPAPNSKIQAA